MREIKFRGKRIDNGEWIYGDLLHFGKNTEILRDIPFGMNESIKVFPGTVGQYTGLKDSKGVEIYEGDRLKESYPRGYMGNVIFKDGAFEISGILTAIRQHTIDHYGLEVTGSIYENPELLEGE